MNDERTPSAVDRRVGQRVRTRRLEIGMSQERLAEVLGVTFQQVQKYEKGANRIAAGRLHDIAQALDLPIAQFFQSVARGSGSAEAEGAISSVLATAEGVELVKLFAAIKSRKVRLRVLDLVRALKDGPERLQWAMNHCLAQIGIEHPEHRARAIAIGERLRVLEDYPTPPNCTSPYAPTWIVEMVLRQGRAARSS